jgi:hypothetical protein
MSMSRAQFLDEVGHAKHGERITYHIGHLMFDRNKDGVLCMTAQAAFRMAVDGHVRLFQSRVGGDYLYIAEKCDPPRPIVWEGCYDATTAKFSKPQVNRLDRSVSRKPSRGGPTAKSQASAGAHVYNQGPMPVLDQGALPIHHQA